MIGNLITHGDLFQTDLNKQGTVNIFNFFEIWSASFLYLNCFNCSNNSFLCNLRILNIVCRAPISENKVYLFKCSALTSFLKLLGRQQAELMVFFQMLKASSFQLSLSSIYIDYSQRFYHRRLTYAFTIYVII